MGITAGLGVTQVATGENHTIAICENRDTNRLFTWGHVGDGRLGLGCRERVGANNGEEAYFPAPVVCDELMREHVVQVCCEGS